MIFLGNVILLHMLFNQFSLLTSVGCCLIVLINETIHIDWIMLSFFKLFTIFLNDLCDRYFKRSRLNTTFSHPSVACDRTDVANYPMCHSERHIWAAGLAVNLQINKEILLCPRISFNIICVYYTFGVFKIP